MASPLMKRIEAQSVHAALISVRNAHRLVKEAKAFLTGDENREERAAMRKALADLYDIDERLRKRWIGWCTSVDKLTPAP